MSERGRDPEGAVAYALAHAGALLGLPEASLAISLPLLLALLDDGVPAALALIEPIAARLGHERARKVLLPHLLWLMEGVGSRGRGATGAVGADEANAGASDYWGLMQHVLAPTMQQRLLHAFGPDAWLGDVLPVILDIIGEATAPEVVRASAATSLAQMAQKSNLGPALTSRYILHPLMRPILRLRPSAASRSCIVALVRLVIELPSTVLCQDIVPPLQGALAAAVELLAVDQPGRSAYEKRRRSDAEAACDLQLQLLGGMIPMLPSSTLVEQLLRGGISLPKLLLRLGVPTPLSQSGAKAKPTTPRADGVGAGVGSVPDADSAAAGSAWESRLALVAMLGSVCQVRACVRTASFAHCAAHAIQRDAPHRTHTHAYAYALVHSARRAGNHGPPRAASCSRPL